MIFFKRWYFRPLCQWIGTYKGDIHQSDCGNMALYNAWCFVWPFRFRFCAVHYDSVKYDFDKRWSEIDWDKE